MKRLEFSDRCKDCKCDLVEKIENGMVSYQFQNKSFIYSQKTKNDFEYFFCRQKQTDEKFAICILKVVDKP